MGSTRIARTAGMTLAVSPAIASTTQARTNVTGSVAVNTKQLRFDVPRAEPRAGDADDHANREQATPARARAFEAHSDNRDRDRIQQRVFVQPSVRLDRGVSGFNRTAGILRELDADDVVRLAWSWGPL